MRKPSFGDLLRDWRKRQRYSQLQLACDAEISTRHISYLENGRAQPSRQMVLLLASALDIPLAQRNQLLLAAGFAPAYRAQGLEGQGSAPVRDVLRFLLRRHQPYPAIIVDPGWNLLMANDAYIQFLAWLTGGTSSPSNPDLLHEGPPWRGSNVLVPFFDPTQLRPMVRNFEETSQHILAQLHHLARSEPAARATLDKLSAHLPTHKTPFTPPPDAALVLPLTLHHRGLTLSLFSTMTLLGTATDAVLAAMRLETWFALDTRSKDELLNITTGSGS